MPRPRAPAVALPEGPALTEAVRARDAEFFDLAFLGCDPAGCGRCSRPISNSITTATASSRGTPRRSSPIMTAPATSGGSPMPGARAASWSRPASTSIPVPGYGAIEDGEHLFYERQGDGPEQLVGRARFTQLWALTPDGWRLARVFSYAHAAAGASAH